MICDTDEVVSTNTQELVSHSVEESKALYKNEFEAGGNGVVRLRSKTGNWYGRREKIKDYDAYIFFPGSSGVPYTNYCMCNLCAACTASFLTFLCEQGRTEKSILQDQKRLCVINALGHAYTSISLVNLKTEEIEIIKASENMKPDQKGISFPKHAGKN